MREETRTNRELAAEARALGEELGEEVSTAGLNKGQLVELVTQLSARVAERRAALAGPVTGVERAAETQDPPAESPGVREEATLEAPPPAAAPQAPVPPRRLDKAYRVAAGRSITTVGRGIRGPGSVIQPDDVDGGVARLEQLVHVGVLVRS